MTSNQGDTVVHEIERLANRMCDSTISAAEKVRLEQILDEQPGLRATYLSYVRLNADLMWQYRTGDSKRKDSDLRQLSERSQDATRDQKIVLWRGLSFSSSLFRPALISICAGVVGISLITLSAWKLSHRAVSPSQTNALASSRQYIATLREATGAFWSGDGQATNVGSRVPYGDVRLDTGDAELVLDSGARLVLSGPVRMRLDSPRSAYLERGKLVAHMPPSAIGFKITTPTATFVDQGTEFGLIAESDGASELHVFRGQVDVHAASEAEHGKSAKQELVDGQALRIEQPGDEGKQVAYSKARFGDVALRVVEPIQWSVEEGGNGHFYQVVVTEKPITWHEAARRAMSVYFHGMPGHLATMTSASENRFVVERVIQELPRRGVWMGLTDVLREAEFRWITGEPVKYTSWATWPEHQPDNFREADWHGGEDYGMFTTFPGEQPWAWNDLSIDSMHETVSAYLVEYEPSIDALQHMTMELEPVEWPTSVGGNGHKYQLVLSLEPVAWEVIRDRSEASSYEGMVGQLVCLETEEERLFITENILQICGIPEIMIGLTGSLRDDSLQWINGQPIRDLQVGRSHLPTDRVYGLLRWNPAKVWPDGWEVYSLSLDVLPSKWFGYIVEYADRSERE